MCIGSSITELIEGSNPSLRHSAAGVVDKEVVAGIEMNIVCRQ